MKLFFCFVLLVLDFVSKIIALQWIPPLQWGFYPFGGIPVFHDFLGISFSLNTIFNTGAAWGLFAGHAGLLFGLRIAIIVLVGFYLFYFHRHVIKMASLWLVVTGAIGNAIDYMLYGHVVDFLHFVFWGYSFPIFNLADSYITIGVMALILRSFQPKSLSII